MSAEKTPWDHLRSHQHRPPISELDTWYTGVGCREVAVMGLKPDRANPTLVKLSLDSWLGCRDLRQVADFCNELADQFERTEQHPQ